MKQLEPDQNAPNNTWIVGTGVLIFVAFGTLATWNFFRGAGYVLPLAAVALLALPFCETGPTDIKSRLAMCLVFSFAGIGGFCANRTFVSLLRYSWFGTIFHAKDLGLAGIVATALFGITFGGLVGYWLVKRFIK